MKRSAFGIESFCMEYCSSASKTGNFSLDLNGLGITYKVVSREYVNFNMPDFVKFGTKMALHAHI